MEFTETDAFRRVPSPKDQSSQAFKGYTSAIRLSILNCRAPAHKRSDRWPV